MEKKIIKLLTLQIERLEAQDFDLDAWKSGAETLLGKFFDPSDGRIKQIKELKIDYSSWALRDSNANYNPVESCKRKGRAILQTAIDEISVLGIKSAPDPYDRLRKHLKEEQVREISASKKKEKILMTMKKDQLVKIVSDFLN